MSPTNQVQAGGEALEDDPGAEQLRRPIALLELARAMRLRQWPKNLLVFLPLLASHHFTNIHLLAATAIAFLAFCLISSAIYLINDLADIDYDRLHPTKKHRPFAQGTLSSAWGYVIAPLAGLAAGGLAASVSLSLLAVVVLYVVITLAYSAWLKQIIVLDIIVLAIFYGLRVVAGYEATGLAYSPWLLAFTQFLFASLAFMKRDIELGRLPEGTDIMPGRGYRRADRLVLGTLGMSSGLISILVLSLYIDSHVVARQYAYPWALWLACPVLAYSLTRIWLLAHRNSVDDDPLMFVLGDPASYVAAVVLVLIGFAAKFGLPFVNLLG